MRQGEDFVLGGEHHAVLAHDAAAAHHRKADGSRPARAGDAAARALDHLVQVHPAPARRRAAQHQGGAGRSIDLAPVVGLEYLDVVVGRRQDPRGLLDQAEQHVHAERIVARLDDGDALGGLGDGGFLFRREAGGADHHAGSAPLGAGGRQRGGGLAGGEVDHHVGVVQGFVGGDEPVSRRVRPVEPPGEFEPLARFHERRDLAPHAAERPGDGDADGRAHDFAPGLGDLRRLNQRTISHPSNPTAPRGRSTAAT